MVVFYKNIFIWCFSWVLISCIADPWPEPDDAAYEEDDGDDAVGDDKNDPWAGSDGDTDKGPTIDYGTDTPNEDSDEHQNIAGLIEDLIFVSAPDADGTAVLVGLPGAVTSDGVLMLMADDEPSIVSVGREGGFAVRVPDIASVEHLSLMLIDVDTLDIGQVILISSSAPSEASDVSDIMGDGGHTKRLLDSMTAVHGRGTSLKEGDLVVAANLTGGVGGIAPTICIEDTCMFSMVIPAVSGDTVSLFLITESDAGGIRNGTVAQTIVID